MPRKRKSTKYLKAYHHLFYWVTVIGSLTSVEAVKMLKRTDLDSEEIPSRTRIHEMLVLIEEDMNDKTERMSKRGLKEFQNIQRRVLLESLADKPFEDYVAPEGFKYIR